MIQIKDEIIRHHCYTELVYDRINKKLGLNLSRDEIEELVLHCLRNAQEDEIQKRGKNYYIIDNQRNIRVTINSHTFRIITVDRPRHIEKFPNKIKRPDFKDIQTFEDFNKFYWYRNELSDICKSIGLDYSGYKLDLQNRISRYFNGEKEEKVSKRCEKHKIVPFKDITIDTALLHCNFSFNNQFRELFARFIGKEKIKFSANMVAALRKVKETQDETFTIRNMIDVYYGKNNYAKYDNKACQWNKFYANFCADHDISSRFTQPLQAASVLWKILRESMRAKEYSRLLVMENIHLLKPYLK